MPPPSSPPSSPTPPSLPPLPITPPSLPCPHQPPPQPPLRPPWQPPGVPTTKNDDVQVDDSISHTHIILGTSDEESSAAILSAVIGSIFGLIALLITIVIIVFARRRKHKLQQRNHDATSIEMATSRNAERASKRESSPTAEVSLTRALSFEPPRKVGQDERPAGHGVPRSPSCTVRVLEDR